CGRNVRRFMRPSFRLGGLVRCGGTLSSLYPSADAAELFTFRVRWMPPATEPADQQNQYEQRRGNADDDSPRLCRSLLATGLAPKRKQKKRRKSAALQMADWLSMGNLRKCLGRPRPIRRGGRAADCTGLENRRRRKSSVGSNPTPSAWMRGEERKGRGEAIS